VIPRFPVYIFDLDGTLLDSAQDICGAVQQVLDPLLPEPVPFDNLKSYIGRHLIELFGDLFPHYSPEQIDALVQQYRAYYHARGHEMTQRFPGLFETLENLEGRKGIATTKGTASTLLVLEKFGIRKYFDHVQGTDGFPCKPAPDVILKVVEALGARPEDCLMVGDSAADMEAGRRAGVKTCAIRHGYGNHQEMALYKPDYWISALTDLLPRPPASPSTPGVVTAPAAE
jgi:HAD superfamily hydrolase (TIGR01509 family)